MSYEEYSILKEKEHESLCRRCGACCGALDDPCEELKKDKEGFFYCRVYDVRLGEKKTVSGAKFCCVPIRDILFENWKGKEGCAYNPSVQGSFLSMIP